MRYFIVFLAIYLLNGSLLMAQIDTLTAVQSIRERNKELARNFYEDLWFNNRTDNYARYMANEYMAHDIGDRKGITEPAVQQKEIADMFWNEGTLSGKIGYQIAENDLVATRWHSRFEANTLKGKLFEMDDLPIINVFRFNDEGKIVELWNHRHDIDTNQTLRFTIKGLLIGLLIALIPTIIAFRYKRRLKRQTIS